jgi:hypothetical protein
MTKHRNLNVLFLCNGPENPIAGKQLRPSWVPDFNFDANMEPYWMTSPLTVYTGAEPYFAATNQSKVDPIFSEDLQELTLPGYYLGTIEACSTLHQPSDVLFAWFLVRDKLARRNEEGVSPRDVFWRTMITNRRADSTPADEDKEGHEFEVWWDAVTKLDYTRTNPMRNYDAAWYQHGLQRCLFTTDTGLVGLARPSVQEGDQVCLLAGAQTPHTLRKNGENYQIVCETYVHGGGIMSGKYWQDLEDAGAERAEFVII